MTKRGKEDAPADARPQMRRPGGWSIIVVLILALALVPLLAIAWRATGDSTGVWPHILANVLPASTLTTVTLLAGVGVMTLVIGTVPAWLVGRYDFPLRRIYDWALVLPLAIPTYIAAYTWGEFADYTGPLQSALRELAGFQTSRDYWFPDIRSTGGAIFLISIVLFPYVYLPARLSFRHQGLALLDAARLLGAGPMRLFFRVGLPAARPAIAVGIILALMETLNDIGAVEYLGVRTLTFSIFDTWLNRSSLAGAAQLSLVLLVVVFAFVILEKHFRRERSFQAPRGHLAPVERIRLSAGRGMLASIACGLPLLLGFMVPFGQLLHFTFIRPDQIADERLTSALLNTLTVSLLTAALCTTAGFLLVYAARRSPKQRHRQSLRFAGLGYAIPGTILAIGMLTALTAFDNFFSNLIEAMTGTGTGLLLSGTMTIIIYACSVRFLAVAIGNIEAGYEKISTNLIAAARTLGRSESQALRTIEIPLLSKTLGVAALFVFVETSKELSATILLRPFNFDTLATFVYERATRAVFERAGFASLLIVIVGLIPVYLLTSAINMDKSSQTKKGEPRTVRHSIKSKVHDRI